MTRTDVGIPTLASRVVRANLLVAVATALSLAATAGTIAWWIWQSRETRRVSENADAVALALESEARQEHPQLADAARDVFQDGAAPGCRVEIWHGSSLVAANTPGAPIGPIEGVSRASRRWILALRALDHGAMLLVAVPREDWRRALSVFILSFVAAAPFCLVLAWCIGRHVAKVATRPIEELRDLLLAARPERPLPDRRVVDSSLEVRELEMAFRQLWERLESALAREKEFAANASHELRTPLTRIQLHIERAGESDTPERCGDLRAATDEIGRMVRLVESLLILTRDPAPDSVADAVNLADVTRSVASRVFEGRGVVLRCPDEALVRGDEDLLSIAVETLLDNGRKFTAAGQDVLVCLSRSTESVLLTVTSPGARISAVEQERVFARFYRGAEARERTRGHGLGLALCRHIARLHQGDVRCASAPEEDAEFVLTMPPWSAAR